ncbi:MAG TPA: nuclear transport factor 2 family protein [Acidimicrobiales bacterium]|nr:nuclear transport factor 2 family protein [Acidimicrobiales bacterium]
MPTSDQVRQRVEAYAASFNSNNRNGFLDCFAEDAVQRDPVTAPANIGLEAIGGFWDNVHTLADEVTLAVHHIHVCGEEAAMVFTIITKSAGGGVEIDAVDIFRVNDEGKIVDFRAYWDPSAMRAIPPQ